MPEKTSKSENGAAAAADKKQQLLELTGTFCDARLNAEYKRVCKKAVEALAKRKPPPYERGRLDIWAAGIVHALGSINFLFDRSFEPYLSATDIALHFGVSPASAANKAAVVRDTLQLSPLSPDYMTKDMQEKMLAPLNVVGDLQTILGGGKFTATGALSDSAPDEP